MAETSVPPVPSLADVERPALAAEGLRARSRLRQAGRRLLHDRAAVAGIILLVAIAVGAAAAPWIAPYSPIEPHYDEALRGPGGDFALGTDNLGRDQLSRLLYGARLSLASVSVATAIIVFVGVVVGVVSGYLGGIVDSAIQRLLEILMAFPSLILALAIAGLLRPSLTSIMIAVISVAWVSYARLVRGMVLATRAQPYVEAAEALGAGDVRIMARQILPNVLAPVIVLATLEMGGLLLAIASLSFLGLGAQPPTPEWGTMLNEARPFFQSNPHLMIGPGLAITLTVLAFNLVGDGLRDALDPRTSGLIAQARRRRRPHAPSSRAS